jgi:hypothetical protein
MSTNYQNRYLWAGDEIQASTSPARLAQTRSEPRNPLAA